MLYSRNPIYILLVLLVVIFSVSTSPEWGLASTKKIYYRVIYTSGRVKFYRKNTVLKRVRSGISVGNGWYVKTYRDSIVILKSKTGYLKLFSYGKLHLGKKPELQYGKLQFSKNRLFENVSYRAFPAPKIGGTVEIKVWGVDARGTPDVVLIDRNGRIKKSLSAYPVGRGSYKLPFSLPLTLKPGRYILKITLFSHDNRTLIKYPFYLKSEVVKTGIVRLNRNKAGILAPSETKQKESEELSGIVSRKNYIQYWEGKFVYPVKRPEIVSDFGKLRTYYIGTRFLFRSFHRGIDFSERYGAPVYAPNAGVVVMAKNRMLTGNTIVIDHGFGVYSLIFHLSSLLKREGEFVKKGELIARVGSSGLAEGSHLHWGLYVNGDYVDPGQWVKIKY